MAPNLIPAIESAGYRYQNLIVWDKTHMGLGSGFRARHELIMHMTCGTPAYHDKGTANVIQCRRVTAAEREHQTQKPVDLLEQLIRVVSPDGGTILDPFMGSGSTGVACRSINRNFIGIERDAGYFGIAIKRIDVGSCLAPNAQGQPAATEPAQQSGRGPLGCADLLGADHQPEKRL
jgi:site-specific DNA-methyltransferase (adenine-specific)